jgi:acyl carrier protein
MSLEEEVIALIARKQSLSPDRITPEMTFYRLGIDGDDAVELIEELCERFSINTTEIDLRRYTIGPEGWGIGPNFPSQQIISLQWTPPVPIDLRVKDLIRSAEGGKWFDPVSPGRGNW